jgi:hypothetical protein
MQTRVFGGIHVKPTKTMTLALWAFFLGATQIFTEVLASEVRRGKDRPDCA